MHFVVVKRFKMSFKVVWHTVLGGSRFFGVYGFGVFQWTLFISGTFSRHLSIIREKQENWKFQYFVLNSQFPRFVQ